jgi:hypothetical protein
MRKLQELCLMSVGMLMRCLAYSGLFAVRHKADKIR